MQWYKVNTKPLLDTLSLEVKVIRTSDASIST